MDYTVDVNYCRSNLKEAFEYFSNAAKESRAADALLSQITEALIMLEAVADKTNSMENNERYLLLQKIVEMSSNTTLYINKEKSMSSEDEI